MQRGYYYRAQGFLNFIVFITRLRARHAQKMGLTSIFIGIGGEHHPIAFVNSTSPST